jgi:uncharacterized protein (TIRG00374 family)
MTDDTPTARIAGAVRDNGLWLTALLTLAVFGGLVAFAEAGPLVTALGRIGWRTAGVVVGLTTVGYVARFLKWHLYLRRLDTGVGVRTSALTFTAGLMMVVTPGKAGELWKAWFLRDRCDVAASRIVPAVGAERITDLLALSGMAATGLVVFGRSSSVLFGVVVVLAGSVLLLQWRRFCIGVLSLVERLPVVGSYGEEARTVYEGARTLFQLRPLTAATGLSLLAWGLEGVALWYILGRVGTDTTVFVGLFVFGLGSVVGAVSLLPGGLGATEASMVGLLVTFSYSEPAAAAATLVVRLGTLWYAAALGTVVFLADGVRRSRRSDD